MTKSARRYHLFVPFDLKDRGFPRKRLWPRKLCRLMRAGFHGMSEIELELNWALSFFNEKAELLPIIFVILIWHLRWARISMIRSLNVVLDALLDDDRADFFLSLHLSYGLLWWLFEILRTPVYLDYLIALVSWRFFMSVWTVRSWWFLVNDGNQFT